MLAVAYVDLGDAYWRLGQQQAGEEALRQGIAIFERNAADFPGQLSIRKNSTVRGGDGPTAERRPVDWRRPNPPTAGPGCGREDVFGFPAGPEYRLSRDRIVARLTTMQREQGRADEATQQFSIPCAGSPMCSSSRANSTMPRERPPKLTVRQTKLSQFAFDRYLRVNGCAAPSSRLWRTKAATT